MEIVKHDSGRQVQLWYPNELMIGNIFRYKGELVEITFLSMDIDDEYQETIGFVKLGESSNERVFWNREICGDFEAVPINSNLMKFCGFVWEEGGIDAKGINYSGTWRHERYLEYPGLFYLPDYSLLYIHQIQNLFFVITGEKLVVKNEWFY